MCRPGAPCRAGRHVVREPRRADDSRHHDQIGRTRSRPGRFRPPAPATPMTLPAFCRVEATARPTSDSEIKFEVWIPPAEAWNGKFQGVGNGGYSGAIGYTALANALRRGYAVGSTDTGHAGDDMKFGQGHPEKVIDYAYRSIHLMTEASKLIVRNAQGRFAEHAYFVGCSSGGHQALHRGAALSGRLRRHRRRRPGEQPHPADLRVSVFVDRDARRRRQGDHPAGQAADDHQRRGRRVRRPRRAEGRHHRRPAPLPVRPGEAALQGGRRRCGVSDAGAGGGGRGRSTRA